MNVNNTYELNFVYRPYKEDKTFIKLRTFNILLHPEVYMTFIHLLEKLVSECDKLSHSTYLKELMEIPCE